MATTLTNNPTVTTVTNTTSAAALDTAVNAEVASLLTTSGNGVIPTSIVIGELVTYTEASTFTLARSIYYIVQTLNTPS